MSRDGQMRPARRSVVAGIGASALGLWPIASRAASGAAPDESRGGAAGALRAGSAPAILYEEEPAAPRGKQFAGDVRWRLETRPAASNGPPEITVTAGVAIPERQLTLNATFRRNDDISLPASHTIDLIFTLPSGFVHGGIEDIRGLLMKENEMRVGVALAGSTVKVTTLYFLVGLSATETDRKANMLLLRDRAWFDVPIVYADKRRAILAFSKGPAGESVFAQAFAAWDAKRAPPSSDSR